MKIFVTGTDTDVGKTTICSWLCIHTNYTYFKPIQTGNRLGTDREKVRKLTLANTVEESYSFREPVSPHLAAELENCLIDIEKIQLPRESNLIIEGAGGIYVPLNEQYLMIDLIESLGAPVILVARMKLGTINHTLLSLDALRKRHIPVLGVILNGTYNESNRKAIEFYGNVNVLASFPEISEVSTEKLLSVKFSEELKSLLNETCFTGADNKDPIL